MKHAMDLHRTNTLAERLSALSRENFYDVYRQFEWPDELAADELAMPEELTTLHGTEVWSSLTDEQKRKLTICETGTLFSNTLNGERLLCAGLSHQLYSGAATPEVTDYLHHFLDEENKHMVMFGVYCRKYVGRVYPEKKFSFERDYAPGEELIRFYSLAMVVEACGDYFNVRTMNDDGCAPVVRQISHLHHVDEARHLSFDRSYLTELTAEYVPQWDDATLNAFRAWLAGFLKVHWVMHYNPSAYRDAGIEDAYEAQQIALAAAPQRALRERASEPVVKFLLKIGLLEEVPVF